MTADRADQARTGLLQAGCSAVLFKPFSGGELHTLIDRSPAVTDAHRWPCNREDPLRNGPLAVRLHWPPAPGLQSAFLGELKRQLPVLDGAITSLNWHEAEHVLHRITGAAALAGFNRLSREARAMLRQVRQQDDTVCLAEHYLELLSQSAMLLRSPPGDADVALRQF
jgi:HPt (histidine-containing phosphotransfer) domain-containing protein